MHALSVDPGAFRPSPGVFYRQLREPARNCLQEEDHQLLPSIVSLNTDYLLASNVL